MEQIKNLSKREKFLLYILILLSIFMFYSLKIKDTNSNKISILNENIKLKTKYDEQLLIRKNTLLELKKQKDVEQIIKNHHQDFGSRIDVKENIQNSSLKLNSYSQSNIQRENKDDLNFYYIESNIIVEGQNDNIINFVELLSKTNYLYIDKISINKKSIDSNILSLNLKEYTILNIPYTGIVNNSRDIESNEEDTIEGNLLQELYDDKKVSNEHDNKEVNVSSEKSNNNTASLKDSKSTNQEAKEDQLSTVVKTETKVEDVLIYKEVNALDPINLQDKIAYIKDNYLVLEATFKNEMKDLSMLLTEEYIKDNSDFMIENSNIKDINHFTDELIIKIKSKISFSDNPIYMNKDNLYLDINLPKDSNFNILLTDSENNLIKLDGKKDKDGWESFYFKIEEDKLNPIRLQGIVLEKAEECGEVKNIISYESN